MEKTQKIWIIYYCFAEGTIDTYEIFLNKLSAEKAIKKLKEDAFETEQFWLTESKAYI